MPTRHAAPDAPLKPWRYASAPEYVEGRGLPGTAVAMKAHLLGDRRQASLLFFIQAMSQREGGLKRFTKEFLDMYPERMPCYTQEVENFTTHGKERTYWEKCDPRPDIEFRLPDLLTSLCTDPRFGFNLEGYTSWGGQGNLQTCSRFKDPLGALLDYQQRYAARVRESFTPTSISTKVWVQLDDCLALSQMGRPKGKVFVIQGESGLGKSWSVRAWAEMYLGEARLVSLRAASPKTTTLRAMSLVLGLPSSNGVSMDRLQTGLESFLATSRRLVLIDEAHYLLPQYGRSKSAPEMLNWIDTALCNEGVWAVLISTPQFTPLLARIVEASGWNASQLITRNPRWVDLPLKPTKADVQAVAASLLAGASAAAVNLAVAHTADLPHPLPALSNLVDDALLLAERAGRQTVTKADVDAAALAYTVPTALATQKISEPLPEPKRNGGRRAVPARDKRAPSAEQFLDQSEAPDNGPPAPRRITPAEPALAV